MVTATGAPAGSAAPEAMTFGMSADAVGAQTAGGVKPEYGTFWIGPWTLSSGWGGPDGQLEALKAADVTPAIHLYYWGDDISPACVENGCWSSLHNAWKDKPGWNNLARQLVDHLNAKMGGRPVVVFLETEFNKGGIQTYEPFDAHLAEMATFLRAGYPQAKVVLPFGNWGLDDWATFDRAAAASDFTGVQAMRGSTKDSASAYRSLYETVLTGAAKLQTLFGKPIFIQDVALSSYPEPDYLQPQADELSEFFAGMADLKMAGVKAIVYRTWLDNPTMNLANYYGEAERHWGLAWAGGAWKPSAKAWVDGVKAERASAAPPSEPPTAPAALLVDRGGASTEVDVFATRTAGGAQSDAAASGGRTWNLWSNGHVQQGYRFAPGEYDVKVRARGTFIGGVGPSMVVTIGGATLAAAPGSTYADHTVRLTLSGSADLRVSFTNDARTATEDRNLVLDRVVFEWVNHAPVAKFEATTEGLSATLDGSGSTDPDGDGLAHAWQFGDGASGAGARVSHEYAADGAYAVTLSVSDGARSATATKWVTVARPNAPPNAAFTATTSGLSVAVDAATSSDPDGDPLTFAWNFGDRTSGAGRTARHDYASPGTYAVTLTASDGAASATATRNVTAVQPNRPPVASFAASTSDLTARLDASGSTDPDGDALTYAWNFGDGASGTGAKASRTYAAPGTYTVTLTVSDGSLAATTSKSVAVRAPSFAAAFRPSANANEWWVEVHVTSSSTLAKVEAQANGGAWIELPRTGWGSYAKSFHVQRGSTVVFRATDAYGQTAASEPMAWLGPAFTATLAPKAVGNRWWVEVGVTASQPLAKVDARLNGGGWFALDPTNWGTWAKSVRVSPGASVEFRATSTAGDAAVSPAYAWK